MILTSWVYVYVPSIHSFNGMAVEVVVVKFNLVSVWFKFSLKMANSLAGYNNTLKN